VTDFDAVGLRDNRSVRVLYDPDNPVKFVITADRLFNRMALAAMIVLGLLFAALGVCNMLGVISII